MAAVGDDASRLASVYLDRVGEMDPRFHPKVKAFGYACPGLTYKKLHTKWRRNATTTTFASGSATRRAGRPGARSSSPPTGPTTARTGANRGSRAPPSTTPSHRSDFFNRLTCYTKKQGVSSPLQIPPLTAASCVQAPGRLAGY